MARPSCSFHLSPALASRRTRPVRIAAPSLPRFLLIDRPSTFLRNFNCLKPFFCPRRDSLTYTHAHTPQNPGGKGPSLSPAAFSLPLDPAPNPSLTTTRPHTTHNLIPPSTAIAPRCCRVELGLGRWGGSSRSAAAAPGGAVLHQLVLARRFALAVARVLSLVVVDVLWRGSVYTDDGITHGELIDSTNPFPSMHEYTLLAFTHRGVEALLDGPLERPVGRLGHVLGGVELRAVLLVLSLGGWVGGGMVLGWLVDPSTDRHTRETAHRRYADTRTYVHTYTRAPTRSISS